MIFYVSHRKHAYTQAIVLLYLRPDLRANFRLVRYEDSGLLRGVAAGVVIWTDLDRLTDNELAEAAGLSDALSGEGRLTQLNHPTRSLRRFDLLRKLHDTRGNGFNVYRPERLPDDIRFPVFIRDEVGALYEEPPLLHDRAALDAAIATPGFGSMRRPMVVEMVGLPSADGFYRKFGAYRIGDTIYAQHISMSESWFVKNAPERLSPEHRREIQEYIRENPRREAVMAVFDAANTQYGRLDYTLHEGRMLVFEINTNPTVLSDPPTPFITYDPQPFADRHAAALLVLPGATAPETVAAIDAAHRRALAGLRRRYQFKRLKIVLGKLFRRR